MVMHPGMADMRGHELEGMYPAQPQDLAVSGGIKMKDFRSILEPLRPFRPSPCRVFALHRKYRRSLALIIFILQEMNLVGGELPEPFHFGCKIRQTYGFADIHHFNQVGAGSIRTEFMRTRFYFQIYDLLGDSKTEVKGHLNLKKLTSLV
jgi:hypothetical protein